MTPALVRGMTDEDYHADPVPGGSLSSTFARLLTEHVPAKAHALYLDNRSTAAKNLGKAAHRQALGAGPELIVWQHDGRTKAGKAERLDAAPRLTTEAAVAVTEEQRDRIVGMSEALQAEPEVAAILRTTVAEVSGFAQENGVWLRSRYDLLATHLSYDYKTTEDASRRGFAKAMAAYGYHQQAEFYLRVLRLLEHPAGDRPFRFICQETRPPYLIQIHTPDHEAMSVAEALNDRAIRVYAEAVAAGAWPGFPTLTPEPTQLPTYYFFNHEDVLPDSWAIGKEMV